MTEKLLHPTVSIFFVYTIFCQKHNGNPLYCTFT